MITGKLTLEWSDEENNKRQFKIGWELEPGEWLAQAERIGAEAGGYVASAIRFKFDPEFGGQR
jgi:hypothetical protein